MQHVFKLCAPQFCSKSECLFLEHKKYVVLKIISVFLSVKIKAFVFHGRVKVIQVLE